jgi:hypothetical protein
VTYSLIFRPQKNDTNKNVYLHFGSHKTGSTSIQMFLKKNKSYLNQNNFDILNTFAGRNTELSHFCLRKSILKFTNPSLCKSKRIYKNIRFKIKLSLFFLFSKQSNFIFSDEGLDYIRTQKEINKVKSLFPANYRIIPILILREKREWIYSWRNYLTNLGLIDYCNKDSPYFYCDDSWYFEINRLSDLLNMNFYKVIYIDYEMNVIPPFIKSVGLEPPNNCNFRLNETKYTS